MQEDSNNKSKHVDSKLWHYTTFGGNPKGPVTQFELNSLHKKGAINDATLIWSEGQSEWLQYSFVFPNVFPPVPGAPLVKGHSPDAEIYARFGAFMIDQLAAVAFVLPGLAFLITPDGSPANFESLRLAFWLIGIGFLLYITTQGLKIAENGQSIGKSALKIKIVDVNTEENPGFIRAYLIRSLSVPFLAFIFLLISPLVTLGFLILDNFFILSPSRRCLHDIAAGTKVVVAE